jgi:hypothetical protein
MSNNKNLYSIGAAPFGQILTHHLNPLMKQMFLDIYKESSRVNCPCFEQKFKPSDHRMSFHWLHNPMTNDNMFFQSATTIFMFGRGYNSRFT